MSARAKNGGQRARSQVQGKDRSKELLGPALSAENSAVASMIEGGAPTRDQLFDAATAGPSDELPFLSQLEEAFGVSLDGVDAHVGGSETEAALGAMGAEGAQGRGAVALPENPSMELVAHEVTHWISEQGGTDALASGPNAPGEDRRGADAETKGSAGAERATAGAATADHQERPALQKSEVPAAEGGEAEAPTVELGGSGDPEGEAVSAGHKAARGQGAGKISQAPRKVRLSEDEDAEQEGPPPDFDIGAALASAMAPIAAPVPAPPTDGEVAIEATNVDPSPTGIDAGAAESTELAPPGDLGLTPPAVTVAEARGEAVTLDVGEGPTATVAVEVPEVQTAYGAFMAAASETRGALGAASEQFGLSITTAAAGAAQAVEAASSALREHIGTAMAAARDQVSTDAQAARDAVRDNLQLRLDALAALSAAQKQRVLDTSALHQQSIQDHTDALAEDAYNHGVAQADALVAHAEIQAELARSAGSSIIGQYAGHDRANDIRITVSRMASETAASLTAEAGRGAAELRADGEALRDKILADGADYKANIAGGDQDTVELFDTLLAEAQAALQGSGDETVAQIDQAETDALSELGTLEEGLLGGVDTTEAAQIAGIDQAKADACEGMNTAIANAVVSLDEQVAAVEAWLEASHPSQWPAIVAALEQATAEMVANGAAAIASLDGVAAAAVAVFDQAGAEAAAGVSEAASAIDGHIQQAVDGANQGFTDLVAGYNEALSAQYVEFETAWTTEADEKIADLDASLDEARAGLSQTHTAGKEEIDQQYRDAVTELNGVVGTARADMAAEADRIANQSWWERFLGNLGAFAMGLLDALVGFLKVLGIILLIVVAVALVVALVILIVKGAAAVAAAAAAVAAFMAAAAKFLAIVGTILTVIGVVFAVVSVVAAWMNPDLTTEEKWRATGKGVGDILLEFLPDFGISLLTKADDVSDVARAVENTGDIIQGLENTEDAASGVRDVANAVDGVEELGDLAAATERVGDGIEEASDLANDLDEVVESAETLRDVSRASDGVNAVDEVGGAAATVDNVTDARAAFDAAKEGGYGGSWETWQRQWDRGLRLSGDPPRWRRPDAPVSTPDTPTTTPDAPTTTPDAPTTTPDAPTTTPDAPTSIDTDPRAAFEAAKENGYSGSWETWQRQWDRGLRLSGDPPRWRRPDPTVTTPDAPTTTPDAPATTPEVPTTTPDAPTTSPDAPTGDVDPWAGVGPEWLQKYREAARLEALEQGVVRPRLQAAYDLYKGIAMSTYQFVTGIGGDGGFIDNLNGIWDFFFTPENERRADAIEKDEPR